MQNYKPVSQSEFYQDGVPMMNMNGADATGMNAYHSPHMQNKMCPCGSHMAGVMMGLLLSITVDLFIDSTQLTLLAMSLGSAFASLGQC